MSEKVYILFYLRNNQGPTSSSSVPCDAKLADCGGNEVLLHHKPAELSKPPVLRPNGMSSSKNNVSSILKNGKISISPQIKSIKFENSGVKKIITNGNTEVRTNGSMEKNEAHKLSPNLKSNTSCGNGSTEKLKVENKDSSSTSKSGAGSVIYSDVVENDRKEISHVSNGHGYSHIHEVARHQDGSQCLVAVDKDVDCDHPSQNMHNKNDSRIGTSKRKYCDAERDEGLGVGTKESDSLSRDDTSCETPTPYHGNSFQELESFKKL